MPAAWRRGGIPCRVGHETAVQEVTVDFVKISNVQVIGDIRKQTRDWMAEIGRQLNESAKVKLDKLWKSIKVSRPGS